jgi:glutathione S-transferase
MRVWMDAESRKILRHVADKYKDQGYKGLFGPGALERASIEQWLQTEAQNFDVPSADMIYSLSYLPFDMPLDGGSPPAASAGMHRQHMEKMEEMRQRYEKGLKEVSKLLNIYEQRLYESEYLAGHKFTLADLSHLPNADAIASHSAGRPRTSIRRRGLCRSRWRGSRAACPARR